MNLSRFFIDRPIFAGVISVVIFFGRPRRPLTANLGISRSRAADRGGESAISRRQPQGDRRDGGDTAPAKVFVVSAASQTYSWIAA